MLAKAILLRGRCISIEYRLLQRVGFRLRHLLYRLVHVLVTIVISSNIIVVIARSNKYYLR